MTTTAIFAEILTVGFQALAWMALTVWVIVTWKVPECQAETMLEDWLAVAKDWAALITLLAVAFAYTAGVIVDRVADRLSHLIKKLIDGVISLIPGGVRSWARKLAAWCGRKNVRVQPSAMSVSGSGGSWPVAT